MHLFWKQCTAVVPVYYFCFVTCCYLARVLICSCLLLVFFFSCIKFGSFPFSCHVSCLVLFPGMDCLFLCSSLLLILKNILIKTIIVKVIISRERVKHDTRKEQDKQEQNNEQIKINKKWQTQYYFFENTIKINNTINVTNTINSIITRIIFMRLWK